MKLPLIILSIVLVFFFCSTTPKYMDEQALFDNKCPSYAANELSTLTRHMGTLLYEHLKKQNMTNQPIRLRIYPKKTTHRNNKIIKFKYSLNEITLMENTIKQTLKNLNIRVISPGEHITNQKGEIIAPNVYIKVEIHTEIIHPQNIDTCLKSYTIKLIDMFSQIIQFQENNYKTHKI